MSNIRLQQRAKIALVIAEALLDNWDLSPRAAARTAIDWIQEISSALRKEITAEAEHSDMKAMCTAIDALDLLLEVVTLIQEHENKEK